MRRHIGLFILLAAVAIVGGAVAWRLATLPPEPGQANAESAGAAAVAVEVAPVTSGMIENRRVFSGTLESSAQFIVSPKVGGQMQRVLVDLGDAVERGQVVAEIDDAEFVQAVAQAEAELAVRRAEMEEADSAHELAKRDFERSETLRQRGIASESQLDQVEGNMNSARAQLALAEARVRQAEASLELARIRLGYTKVRADWTGGTTGTGVVGERYQDAGNNVQSGDPILSIVALDPLRAIISVTERDYARLSVGQEATLRTDAIAGETFSAVVERISPVFMESSRQARVELRVENRDGRLKPGMFARVTIVLERRESDRIVPLAALARRSGEDVVFVVDDEGGRVSRIPVDVGIVEDDRAEIIDGAVSGRVVVLGQQLLEDGSPISITDGLSGEGSAAGDEAEAAL